MTWRVALGTQMLSIPILLIGLSACDGTTDSGGTSDDVQQTVPSLDFLVMPDEKMSKRQNVVGKERQEKICKGEHIFLAKVVGVNGFRHDVGSLKLHWSQVELEVVHQLIGSNSPSQVVVPGGSVDGVAIRAAGNPRVEKGKTVFVSMSAPTPEDDILQEVGGCWIWWWEEIEAPDAPYPSPIEQLQTFCSAKWETEE